MTRPMTIAQPRRSKTAAAMIVVVALTVCGALIGALWAWIAPPIHTITALTRSGERVDAFLGAEADNLFVAAAMMIGLLVMLAIVAAVAVWQWRAHRGPVLATALWVGLVAAGAAAAIVLAAPRRSRTGVRGDALSRPAECGPFSHPFGLRHRGS